MKKLFLAVCALVICSALYAQSGTTAGTEVSFHNFPWGTSQQEFTAKMGRPAHIDEYDGLQSLLYDNVIVSGYPVFLLAYFSRNGLEGGTYYFHTFSLDELMKCYTDVQKELLEKYGSTNLRDIIFRERAPYESSWNLPGGYVHLKVDTRKNDPVTLMFSSPALARKILGS